MLVIYDSRVAIWGIFKSGQSLYKLATELKLPRKSERGNVKSGRMELFSIRRWMLYWPKLVSCCVYDKTKKICTNWMATFHTCLTFGPIHHLLLLKSSMAAGIRQFLAVSKQTPNPIAIYWVAYMLWPFKKNQNIVEVTKWARQRIYNNVLRIRGLCIPSLCKQIMLCVILA